MSDAEIKVNDKRMFTPEGELREEYRHLEREVTDGAEEAETAEAPPEQPPEEAPERPAGRADETPPGPEEEKGSKPPRPTGPIAGEKPGEKPRLELGAGFQELVALLAEHAAVYLGERSMPDGRSMQDLQAAQLHIDLLDVLREKTSGNLSEQEARLLEDVLYQLRLAYVEKRRQGS